MARSIHALTKPAVSVACVTCRRATQTFIALALPLCTSSPLLLLTAPQGGGLERFTVSAFHQPQSLLQVLEWWGPPSIETMSEA